MAKISTTQERDSRGVYTKTVVFSSLSETLEPDLSATSYRVQTDDTGRCTVTNVYTNDSGSGGGGGGTNGISWAVEVSTSEEPLESHPKLAGNGNLKAWLKYKENPTDSANIKWADSVTDVNIQNLYKAWVYGQTSYKASRIVVRKTELLQTLPSLEGVGKIASESFPFSVPSGVNFLLDGISAVQEGAGYRVTTVYLGSAPGGWNSDWY